MTTVRITRLSLRWRVAVSFGLGSLVITGILATATWNLASGYMLRQRELSATAQTEVNVHLVDNALRQGSGGLGDLLTGLTTDSDSSVLLERPQGWINSGRQIDPGRLPASLLELGERGIPARQRLIVEGVPVLAVTLPVSSGGSTYIELFPLTQLDRAFRYISSVLITGVAASALLGVAIGLWTSRRAPEGRIRFRGEDVEGACDRLRSSPERRPGQRVVTCTPGCLPKTTPTWLR